MEFQMHMKWQTLYLFIFQVLKIYSTEISLIKQITIIKSLMEQAGYFKGETKKLILNNINKYTKITPAQKELVNYMKSITCIADVTRKRTAGTSNFKINLPINPPPHFPGMTERKYT